VFGEGPAAGPQGAFKEDRVKWTVEDFRFTGKGDTVYAFQMKHGDGGTAAVRSLGLSSGLRATGVRILGHGAPMWHEQRDRALLVAMPDKGSTPVPCIAVTIA
jgi:alpha-L-fucosidase